MSTENSIEIITQKIIQSKKEIDELKKQIGNIQRLNDQLNKQLAEVDTDQIKRLDEENKALRKELESLQSRLNETDDNETGIETDAMPETGKKLKKKKRKEQKKAKKEEHKKKKEKKKSKNKEFNVEKLNEHLVNG